MITRAIQVLTQFETVVSQIRRHCNEFHHKPRDAKKSKIAINRISQLLDFIPMASDDFGVALSRLNNANRYLDSAEFGAAQYEIRLFEGTLRQFAGRQSPVVFEADLLDSPIENPTESVPGASTV
ncbi:MAG: hypothetical protein ABL888_01810 [Pirellulaceae bacterium]